jgi:cytochrome c2
MPATDKYWRPIKRMHVVFALSCLLVLLVTFWMMAADHDREWKPIQRTNEDIVTLQLQLELQRKGALSSAEIDTLASKLTEEQRFRLGLDTSSAGTSDYAEQRDALEARVEAAEEALRERHEQIAPLEAEVRRLKTEFDVLSIKQKVAKAELDKAAADRGLAVRDELPEERIASLQADFEAKQEEVDEAVLAVEDAAAALAEKQAELAAAEQQRNDLQAELKELRSDEIRLREARNKLAPETTAGWLKRKSMEWPILDGFNSHLRIRQDWLPELDITLGMATTARFDRCRTCHLNAAAVLTGGVPAFPPAHGHVESDDYRDWVAENAYPQPYATHPRTDVYLTATSPHPVETFGCTICHQGNGSGTSFQAAEHGPNEPHEEHEWADAHGYHPNHFWEYPMLPERFVESTCIKCHHDVVELGVHPTYGPTAPKVVKGYDTISSYGCFGCHEVHGFDGERRIGPDIRSEPNYTGAASQILADAFFENADAEALAASNLGSAKTLVSRVLAQPMDVPEQRAKLRDLLEADKESDEPLLSNRTHDLASVLADEAHPGKFRKVGPSLRHVGTKTSRGWLEFWTEEPQRFRPTTRMPQFWDLSNQLDAHAQELEPVEVAAVVQYLLDKSQSSLLLAPDEDYVPDVKRGAAAFARKGCLACHQIDMFPKGTEDQGPDLSRIHAKIKPGFKDGEGNFDVGSEGFRWVYTWILDPERHHPRTKMPNLFVNEIREHEIPEGDAAADIAAFLLTNRYSVVLTAVPPAGDDFDEVVEIVGDEALGLDPDTQRDRILPYLADLPKVLAVVADEESLAEIRGDLEDLADLGATIEDRRDDIGAKFSHDSHLEADDETLDELVRMMIEHKVLTARQTEEFLESRVFPRPAEKIKGDEIELAGDAPASDEEWRIRKLNYVGRKTISKYGCFGCHDVPGFETARPIGTVLQDWGRKDTSKLATEHIHEYLKHHGEPGGGSTEERVESAIARSRGGEYETDEEAADALSPAYFYEDLLHHGRAGFLWQKLRAPRSYDFEKIETKGYDERLRMPRFPFDEEQIEAVATFVLGLVAEPPPTQYRYQPDPRATDRIEGEFLLEKYNCVGCHYTEMPRMRVAIAPDGAGHFTSYESVEALAHNPDADFYESALRQMLDLRPIQQAYRGTTPEGRSIIEFHGLLDSVMIDPAEDPGDMEWNYLNFTTWENLDVGLKDLRLNDFERTEMPEIDAETAPEEEVPYANGRAWSLRFNGPIHRATVVGEIERNLTKADPGHGWAVRSTGPDGPGIESGGEMRLEVGRTRVLTDAQKADLNERKRLKAERQKTMTKEEIEAEAEAEEEELAREREEIDEFVERALEFVQGRLAREETRLVTLDAPLIRVAPTDVLERDDGRGGAFALHLVELLLERDPYTPDTRFANAKKLAWQSVPPPLIGEGSKVQTEWLYRFLRNPERLRKMTVLRMPRFNLSDAEARTLANYFAARDGAPYPYQNLEQRDPGYLAEQGIVMGELTGEPVNYLEQSWRQLHDEKVQCYKCHQFGSAKFDVPLTFMKDTRGPDLKSAGERLRPEYLEVWLSKPAWLLPYTGMPVNYPKPKAGEAPKSPLFGGHPDLQVLGVRDALLNYHEALETFGKIDVAPPTPDGATDPMGNPTGAPPADPAAPPPADDDEPRPAEPEPSEPSPGDDPPPEKGDAR